MNLFTSEIWMLAIGAVFLAYFLGFKLGHITGRTKEKYEQANELGALRAEISLSTQQDKQ